MAAVLAVVVSVIVEVFVASVNHSFAVVPVWPFISSSWLSSFLPLVMGMEWRV